MHTRHAPEKAVYWEEIKCRRLFGFPEMFSLPSCGSASNQAARYAPATGCPCLSAAPRAAYLCCVSQPVTGGDAHGYALNSPPSGEARRIANIALQAISISILKFFSLPLHGAARFRRTCGGWGVGVGGVLRLQPNPRWGSLSHIYGGVRGLCPESNNTIIPPQHQS